MRKWMSLGLMSAGLLGLGLCARAQDANKDKDAAKPAAEAPAKEEAKGGTNAKSPETIVLDKTNKMAPVNFPHAVHQKKFACKECHEGDKPLFPQKKAEEGMKMADMYAGKGCGSCHDGKKSFAAKAGCMKCHKKAEASK